MRNKNLITELFEVNSPKIITEAMLVEYDDWDDVDEYDDEEADVYTLVGLDGNIYNLIANVAIWMKKEGCDRYEIERFRKEVTMQHNYHDALGMCLDYTDLCNDLHRKNQNR